MRSTASPCPGLHTKQTDGSVNPLSSIQQRVFKDRGKKRTGFLVSLLRSDVRIRLCGNDKVGKGRLYHHAAVIRDTTKGGVCRSLLGFHSLSLKSVRVRCSSIRFIEVRSGSSGFSGPFPVSQPSFQGCHGAPAAPHNTPRAPTPSSGVAQRTSSAPCCKAGTPLCCTRRLPGGCRAPYGALRALRCRHARGRTCERCPYRPVQPGGTARVRDAEGNGALHCCAAYR